MPIIGALLGQQHGRDISLEHAFECIVVEGPDGELSLPPDWFIERVKQCKRAFNRTRISTDTYSTVQSRMFTRIPH